MTLTVGSLFSGIGGFDLGLERAGMKVLWQVENDSYCNRVLAKHWPDVTRYGDIHTVRGDELAPVDVVCGGFPCQPVSLAGKRRGADDERWLWPEFARILRLVRPRFALIENVPGLFVRGFDTVLADLAALGFNAEWAVLRASDVGAPHRRERIFIVAHANREQLRVRPGGVPAAQGAREGEASERQWLWANAWDGRAHVADTEVLTIGSGLRSSEQAGERRGRSSNGSGTDPTDTERDGLEGIVEGWTTPRPIERDSSWWAVEPNVGRVAHGVPARVDRLRGLGNAIVPQVAEVIGRQLLRSLSGPSIPTQEAQG